MRLFLRPRVFACTAVFVLTLALSLVLAPGWWGANFHEVLPGRVFRSGQLSPRALENAIEARGLRSIVNLRGAKPGEGWYDAEADVARRRGLSYEDLDLPKRLPSRLIVLRLIHLVETLPEPVLVHCKAGSDRSGFASVLVRLVKGREAFSAARFELGLLYGHVRWGSASELTRFFDLYEKYLDESHGRDAPETFKAWVENVYVPYNHLARIEPVSFPERVGAASVVPVSFRVTNTSPSPWRFRESPDKGIRLGIKLRPSAASEWQDYHRAGFFNMELPAGQSYELETKIEAPSVPGLYFLKADMVDEFVAWFEDEGSAPLVLPLRVEAERGVGRF